LKNSRRSLTRVALFLIGVILIIGSAAGIIWYLFRQARTIALQPGATVDISSIEKTLLGIYLNTRKDEIETPVSMEGTPIYFAIEPGENGATVATRLERMGLIADAELFRLLLRYWEVDAQIEVGEYSLERSMSMSEIVGQLQHGRLRAKTVTIREGLRAEEVAHLLASEGLVDQEEFIRLIRDDAFHYDFLRDRPADAPPTLEGFVFPDTYQFAVNITATALIDIMLHNFDQRVTIEMRQQALDQGLELYHVLTLASIIEREAVIAEERPIMSTPQPDLQPRPRLNPGGADPCRHGLPLFPRERGRLARLCPDIRGAPREPEQVPVAMRPAVPAGVVRADGVRI